MFVVLAMCMGLIVGSFLNVVVLRKGTGQGIGGRSACMSCGYQLRWFDLIPIISWIYLFGKCRRCGSKISVQYPLVELGTAIAFGIIAARLAPLIGAFSFPIGVVFVIIHLWIVALLIAILVYDFRHTIIPDTWVYAFIALAIVAQVFQPFSGQFSPWLLLSGPVVASPLFFLWAVSGGRWMGFGDVKLALGMGYLLGFGGGLMAVMLAFMIGGVISAPLLFLSSSVGARVMHMVGASRRRFAYTMKSEVPFGPFLIAATCALWFAGLYGISIPL